MNALNVVGARPNFMKIAPLVHAMARRRLSQTLVHTGQHYDARMSRVFFDELGIPKPDIDLEVGSASHAVQTGEILIRFDAVLDRLTPDILLVVGDVNSTLACALAAAKRHIPVAHIEAGLRSFDRAMPEEINRVLTDHLADFCFSPSPDADANLRAEGVADEKIFCVGNIMIDTLMAQRERALASTLLVRLSLEPGQYALATLHRPSNVDDPALLKGFVELFAQTAAAVPLVFPVHPRTRAQAEKAGLWTTLQNTPGLILTEPLGYLDFMALTAQARFVMTDSGGLQEETTVFGIPCLTLRENTDRPVTITEGTNTLTGTDPTAIWREAEAILAGHGKTGRIPELWDGRTAERILDILTERL